MRKSVFSEYFHICATVLVCSTLCIVTCLMLVSSGFYKSEQKHRMIDVAQDALSVTILNIRSEGAFSPNFLRNTYINIAQASEIEFILLDEDGVALVCSEAPPCSHTEKRISPKTLEKVNADGFYEISSLDNYYDKTYYNLAYKFEENGETYYIFARQSIRSLQLYISKLLVVVLIVGVTTVMIAYLLLYFATKKLILPIQQMTVYARKFGDGEFTDKIDIVEENEFGYLAHRLNEMATSLEYIEENRKSFVSNVSHELRTPMTTIGGFVDGILDGTIPPEKHKAYLRIVSDEIDRLARLVRSMLNISKFEAGELKLQTEVFDIMPIVVRTCLLFEVRIEAKEIDVEGLDSPPFMVNADADLIQQVIYNLVENAVKFTNRGGYIKFSFDTDENGNSIVRIKNSGMGLKNNEISKVFDRFYKADESRGIDKTGVGLGLSIVRSIIKLHDGVIIVHSEPDQYAEFEFSLKGIDDSAN